MLPITPLIPQRTFEAEQITQRSSLTTLPTSVQVPGVPVLMPSSLHTSELVSAPTRLKCSSEAGVAKPDSSWSTALTSDWGAGKNDELVFSAHSWTDQGFRFSGTGMKGSRSTAWPAEEAEVVGVRLTTDSDGWLEIISVSIPSAGGVKWPLFSHTGELLRVEVLERVVEEWVASSVPRLSSVCISSAKGFARADPRAPAFASVFRFRKSRSWVDGFGSAAVVLAPAFSSMRTPSLSTKSSKLFEFSLHDLFCKSRFSWSTLPLSRISYLALRRRSTASGLSSGRVDGSGEEFRVGERGPISSPRLWRATAIFRLDVSTHWRTWGFS